MESFIKAVLIDLKNQNYNFENVCFILPSKRAGVFLKHQLSSQIKTPIFAPEVISIEEFVEDLSGLRNLSNTELLFKLYSAYKTSQGTAEAESFDSFSKWAQILLQDFNEIDRYLIPQEKIFEYIIAIYKLNNWSLDSGSSDLIQNYLKFWNKLNAYYQIFTDHLLESKEGYQGLIYREAAENLESYIEHSKKKTHVFLGFNALNTAESQIIQGLLKNDLACIYWDIDKTFIEDPIHDAGLFTRSHKNEWKYFNKQPFNWVSSHYKENKTIEVVGIPKLVGQAKYIGKLLDNIRKTNKDLSNVAVVLGEENLLIPVLNSIPREVTALNVTMGLPLKFVPLASVFEYLFLMHKHKNDKYYYKDIVDILSHPSIRTLFKNSQANASDKIIEYIQLNNLVYISGKELNEIANSEIINVIFGNWDDNTEVALKSCSQLIFMMKTHYDEDKTKNRLELEYLYRFNALFNQLIELNRTYNYINSISTLHSIFIELLSSETLDFKGEPLDGLQIMGMLESRALDFDTVIISSVNEGILPSGKTNNSFIPFNVKVENGLPTYKEKDAVYTYHFYRLLQRAKNVHILYNTEVDALKGGEKSRFITQLEIENIHQIKHTILSPEVPPIKKQLKQISKTDLVLEELKILANKGFSPSSLTSYIRNPINFYYEKILGIKQFEDVEENIAANTLGSIIHDTLEDFYKPLEKQQLTLEHLKEFKSLTHKTVTKHFKKLYKKGDFSRGKNLIVFEIAKRYISNFIDSEIELIKTGQEIIILAIEAENTIEVEVEGLNYPIKLTGKVDRIDSFNGTTRVIDYKSGKVEQNKVEIVNWEDLNTDYEKFSKPFQILCYAYMIHHKNMVTLPIEAGIISFKNLNAGFLKFGTKESANSRKKDQLITEETLKNFEIELKKLILEICNPKLNFIEKELD